MHVCGRAQGQRRQQAAKLSGLSELAGRVGMEGLVGTSAVFRFGTGFGAVLVKWAHLAFAHFAAF